MHRERRANADRTHVVDSAVPSPTCACTSLRKSKIDNLNSPTMRVISLRRSRSTLAIGASAALVLGARACFGDQLVDRVAKGREFLSDPVVDLARDTDEFEHVRTNC